MRSSVGGLLIAFASVILASCSNPAPSAVAPESFYVQAACRAVQALRTDGNNDALVPSAAPVDNAALARAIVQAADVGLKAYPDSKDLTAIRSAAAMSLQAFQGKGGGELDPAFERAQRRVMRVCPIRGSRSGGP